MPILTATALICAMLALDARRLWQRGDADSRELAVVLLVLITEPWLLFTFWVPPWWYEVGSGLNISMWLFLYVSILVLGGRAEKQRFLLTVFLLKGFAWVLLGHRGGAWGVPWMGITASNLLAWALITPVKFCPMGYQSYVFGLLWMRREKRAKAAMKKAERPTPAVKAEHDGGIGKHRATPGPGRRLVSQRDALLLWMNRNGGKRQAKKTLKPVRRIGTTSGHGQAAEPRERQGRTSGGTASPRSNGC